MEDFSYAARMKKRPVSGWASLTGADAKAIADDAIRFVLAECANGRIVWDVWTADDLAAAIELSERGDYRFAHAIARSILAPRSEDPAVPPPQGPVPKLEKFRAEFERVSQLPAMEPLAR